ncbi:MAG: hypothetical protein JXA90_02020 [Planctomycetes bacterium]|nr:hypothetical protein [Planctomycetota bacterium]
MKERAYFASEETRALLQSNGLADLTSAFGAGRPVETSRHGHKEVAVAEARAADGQPVRLFIKRQWKLPRLLPRLGDALRGGMFQPDPVREWQGLQKLRSAGLKAAEPLALFCAPLGVRSAVVTREVPAQRSLADWLSASRAGELADEEMRALAAATMATMRRIHDAGIGWKGMSPKHLFPRSDGRGAFEVWIIDAEGVHAHLKRRDERRDFRNFLKGLHQVGGGGPLASLLELSLNASAVAMG